MVRTVHQQRHSFSPELVALVLACFRASDAKSDGLLNARCAEIVPEIEVAPQPWGARRSLASAHYGAPLSPRQGALGMLLMTSDDL